MGKSGYTSLSIEEKRYAKLRRSWEQQVETNETFTVWMMNIMENSLNRLKYVQETFPDYSIIKIADNELILEDSKMSNIVKVTIKDENIICNVKKNAEKYIRYALLHPQLQLE